MRLCMNRNVRHSSKPSSQCCVDYQCNKCDIFHKMRQHFYCHILFKIAGILSTIVHNHIFTMPPAPFFPVGRNMYLALNHPNTLFPQLILHFNTSPEQTSRLGFNQKVKRGFSLFLHTHKTLSLKRFKFWEGYKGELTGSFLWYRCELEIVVMEKGLALRRKRSINKKCFWFCPNLV